MPEQLCVCSHPFSIHRLNRQIGDRNECWAALMTGGLCLCRQYAAEDRRAATRGEGEP